jgi:RNA polymerase sigma-70 factor (ECF subfamily)
VNDPTEAADLLQDVFMEVWRGADRFEGRAKVQTWIFGIARRKAIDAHRRRGRLAPEEEAPEEADDSPDALACLAAGQEASHVRHCLGELREAHRSVVALAFYEDMTQAEIAEVEGVPEGIVKSRLHHAKRLLLRCLEGRMGRRVA